MLRLARAIREKIQVSTDRSTPMALEGDRKIAENGTVVRLDSVGVDVHIASPNADAAAASGEGGVSGCGGRAPAMGSKMTGGADDEGVMTGGERGKDAKTGTSFCPGQYLHLMRVLVPSG